MPRTGRPRLTLGSLVESGSFDHEKRTHRRLIFENDLGNVIHPAYDRLSNVQRQYRNAGGVGPDGVFIAKMFESVVLEAFNTTAPI